MRGLVCVDLCLVSCVSRIPHPASHPHPRLLFMIPYPKNIPSGMWSEACGILRDCICICNAAGVPPPSRPPHPSSAARRDRHEQAFAAKSPRGTRRLRRDHASRLFAARLGPLRRCRLRCWRLGLRKPGGFFFTTSCSGCFSAARGAGTGNFAGGRAAG